MTPNLEGLTPEHYGILRYLTDAGVKFRVTDVDTPNVHSATSYHYRGLALDLSGPSSPWAAGELLSVFAAFGAVESQLAELYYSGAPYGIRNGQRIRPGQSIIETHWNHVHVAVPKGTVLKEQTTPMDKEKIISAFPYQDGYVLVTEGGAVYCFGCEYKGGLVWDGNEWVLR